jgi:hypothetical protein
LVRKSSGPKIAQRLKAVKEEEEYIDDSPMAGKAKVRPSFPASGLFRNPDAGVLCWRL